MKTEYKYIYFDDISSLYSRRKTETFNCRNVHSTNLLGKVSWLSRWRQYCFSPNSETVFNSTCLVDISHFLTQLNDGHKTKSRK